MLREQQLEHYSVCLIRVFSRPFAVQKHLNRALLKLILWRILRLFLFLTPIGTYEGGAAEDAPLLSAGLTCHTNYKKDYPMAFTPSKDQKRRDREQKKLDKRLAKEDAKAEKLAAQQAADEEAAEEAIEAERLAGLTKEEADFEAELAAEAAAAAEDSK